MITKQLDKILRNNTLDFIGVKNNVTGFNVGISSLCCVILIKEREDLLASYANNFIERYTSESLLDELIDTGVKVNDGFAAILQQIEQEELVSVDEKDSYHSKNMSSILVQLFDLVYPTMKGLLLIAYFIQTVEEVYSERKSLQEAVNQVNQVLKSQGVAIDLKQLSKKYRTCVNQLSLQIPQSNINDTNNAFISVLSKRSIQREKTLRFIYNKMQEQGGLPVLSLNNKYLNQIINKIASSTSDLSEIILSDVGMTSNILKIVNQKRKSKSVLTVSHAIMLLGHEQLHKIIKDFKSIDIVTDADQKKELEMIFLSSYMGKTITENFAKKKEVKDIEEVIIGSMLHNLGQMIVLYYHPEAYFKIKKLMKQRKKNKRKASREILGITYDNIGIHFARQWNFHFLTIESLRVCYFNRVGKTKENLMINLPFCSNELCAFSGGVLDGMHKIRLKELINSLNMFSKDILSFIEQSWVDVTFFSKKHNIEINRRLLAQISATG